MIEENSTHNWRKILAIGLISFIASFLAFYIVMEIMVRRVNDPIRDFKHVERMIQHQQRDFRHAEERLMENPFVPKMRPMIVNLVKESGEYKVIIDLTPLEGDENSVAVNVDGKVVTITGELDKKIRGNERIINFAQSYYLDEKLLTDKIIKEKKGNKYIVTIPYED